MSSNSEVFSIKGSLTNDRHFDLSPYDRFLIKSLFKCLEYELLQLQQSKMRACAQKVWYTIEVFKFHIIISGYLNETSKPRLKIWKKTIKIRNNLLRPESYNEKSKILARQK